MIIIDDHFDKAFSALIKQEGGYVNHPDDPGGETKYGITKRDFPNLDIKNLKLEKAREIYYEKYWVPSKCNMLSNYYLAEKLFSLTVNMGQKQAAIMLQRALRAATGRILTEDGIIGIKTIGAMEVAMLDQLLIAMRSEAAGYYRGIVIKTPSKATFLNGWLNRAYA